MALPINIANLINRRVLENARIEYKGNWNPEPILHSIYTFANDIDNRGGGYIIIGIEEENGMPKLAVKELEKSSIDRFNNELLVKCNLIEPRYVPVAFPTEKLAKYDKAYYIRKMSYSIRANQMDVKELS